MKELTIKSKTPQFCTMQIMNHVLCEAENYGTCILLKRYRSQMESLVLSPHHQTNT